MYAVLPAAAAVQRPGNRHSNWTTYLHKHHCYYRCSLREYCDNGTYWGKLLRILLRLDLYTSYQNYNLCSAIPMPRWDHIHWIANIYLCRCNDMCPGVRHDELGAFDYAAALYDLPVLSKRLAS